MELCIVIAFGFSQDPVEKTLQKVRELLYIQS